MSIHFSPHSYQHLLFLAFLITEEEVKERWQESTELYKKGLNDPDNHDDVVTHLEMNTLECEVKWM